MHTCTHIDKKQAFYMTRLVKAELRWIATALLGSLSQGSLAKGFGLYAGPVEGVGGTYHCSSKVEL